MLSMETMRNRDAKSGLVLWTASIDALPARDNRPAKVQQSATWADEGTPWLALEPENIVFNTNISDYIHQTGP
jgi:hypothetical protein